MKEISNFKYECHERCESFLSFFSFKQTCSSKATDGSDAHHGNYKIAEDAVAVGLFDAAAVMVALGGN